MIRAAATVLAIILVLWLRHALAWRRASRQRQREHPPGPDGVVAGAESIALDAGRFGVLILHGFGDSPQSVVPVARALHAAGMTVRAPLLPGHGRTLEVFSHSCASEWEQSTREAYAALRVKCEQVAVVGVSMGAALASLLATQDGKQRGTLTSLVLITPYLSMTPSARWVTPIWPIWSLVRPFFTSDKESSIREPNARADSLGYGITTPRLLRELRNVVDRGIASSARQNVPTLMIASEHDYRIPAETARAIFDHIGSSEKELRWVRRSGHVVTVDFDREEVAALTVDWIRRHFAASSPND